MEKGFRLGKNLIGKSFTAIAGIAGIVSLFMSILAIYEYPLNKYWTGICIAFICLVVLAQIVIFPYMYAALIVVSPFLGFMIFFDYMPANYEIILCVIYVFASATLGDKGKNSNKELSCIAILPIMVIASFVVILLFPQKDYLQYEFFEDARIMICDFAYNNFGVDLDYRVVRRQENNARDHGVAGIGDGTVGQIDGISVTGSVAGTLIANSTGNDLFLTANVGVEYAENDWNFNGESSRREQTNLKSSSYNKAVWEEYSKNKNLQNYAEREIKDFNLRQVDRRYYFSGNILRIYNAGFATRELNYQTLRESQILGDGYIDYCLKNNDFLTFSSVSLMNEKKEIYERYLDVPKDAGKAIDKVFGHQQLTNNREVVEYIYAVKEYLSTNYKYTVTPGKIPEGREVVEYFLTEGKEGYCTYFATSAAMIFRRAGIPTRYCVGYLVTDEQIRRGEFNESKNEYTVEVLDDCAHAWIEVFLEGYGWTYVDVTPSAYASGSPFNKQKNEFKNSENEVRDANKDEDEELTDETSEDTTDTLELETEAIENQEITENKEKSESFSWEILGVIAFACLVAILVIVIVFIRKKRQGLFNPEININDKKVMDLYNYLEKILSRAGIKREESCDYETFAMQAISKLPELEATNLMKVIEIVLRVRFSESKNVDKEEIIEIINTIRNVKEITRKVKRNR